ncbi:competence protein ComK [Neobacillus sp. LXY-4]|uniref:competence protein ComK n=1 Tax=Neobacillus sp. LXY-4 TaxID=3379826 RepID=UPI003EDF798F
MEILTNYVINTKTSVIIPMYEKNGYLYSCVIEGKLIFLVAMSPRKLINQSLLYFAKDLKGASSGAKSILGNISMLPISICSQLGIFWFPSNSPSNEDCIWIAQAHVVDYKQTDKHKTDVYLSSGHIVTINMNKKRFEKKFDRATKLRHVLTERIKSPEKMNTELGQSGFQIRKEPGKNNYEINGLDE